MPTALGEEQGVHVVAERHTRVPGLSHPVQGLKAAGQSDFDDGLTERPDVADDVDVAGAGVRGPIVDVLDGGVDLRQALTQPGGCLLVAVGLQRLQGVAVVGLLLLQSLALAGHLLLDLGLLAQPGLLRALSLLLLLLLGQVVRGQPELLEPQDVVAAADRHAHRLAELGDRLRDLVQPGARGVQLVRLKTAHEVVGPVREVSLRELQAGKRLLEQLVASAGAQAA